MIPDDDVDEDKVGLKVEDGEEKEEEDDDNLEVSDEDVDGTNDDEEEDRLKKTKDVMPKYLSFRRGSRGQRRPSSPKRQQGDPAGVQDHQGHIQEASKEGH